MITQYTTSYSTISSDIQNITASKVSSLDKYVLMQTGEYEYSALVYNPLSKVCTQYVFRRTSGTYSSPWTMSTIENVEFQYNITNEYYVCSNEGYGKMLDLPCYEPVSSFSLSILTCTLILAIAFKGVLFKCLKRKS